MESLANLISSLSTLAWPILAGILALKFFPPLKNLIESAKGRKFTVKVGGNELTMEEASEQQRLMTSDIQNRLADLEKRISVSNAIPNFSTVLDEDEKSIKRILWVDDAPKNNSYLVATLEEQGHVIDIALDTTEGMRKFRDTEYDVVISDMGRPRDKQAGITLSKEIRAINPTIPIFIFCGQWASNHLKILALDNGVTDITSSGSSLLSSIVR